MGIQKKLNAPLGNHLRIVIWNRDSELLRNGTMVLTLITVGGATTFWPRRPSSLPPHPA
jgi:hypothetical protein